VKYVIIYTFSLIILTLYHLKVVDIDKEKKLQRLIPYITQRNNKNYPFETTNETLHIQKDYIF
jgi:hypothetical protein